MTEEPRLEVYESGDRTGYLTASGDAEYTGENSYVAGVFDRYEGGYFVTYHEDVESPFGSVTKAERVTGEELFEAVRARLDPLDLDVRIVSADSDE
ncbi:hypothetical protein [Halomicrobium urmianum]|uniref:hypothetical protein n=1 Tax=Halomicrobium urmianum TaxID=1586233 RepID=UPI001CD9D6E9|nr:hypothetical protein [Halomicrobium urmianum]